MKQNEKLGYEAIAKELKVSKVQLQNFVKGWQRQKDKEAFLPDGWTVFKTAPGHWFTREKADKMKAAYIEQRVKKAWKRVRLRLEAGQ